MRGTKPSDRFTSSTLSALVAALVLTGGGLGAAAEPAAAAFPGKNGKIAFASTRTTGPGVTNPRATSKSSP